MSMGEAQIRALGERAGKLMAQRRLAKQPQMKVVKGKYGQSRCDVPVQYDPKKYPPGSVIQSEMVIVDTTIKLSPEESDRLRITMHCQKCGWEGENRVQWRQHNTEAHDGRAMWGSGPHVKPFEHRYRGHGRRADGEIRSTQIDGMGRTIVGTAKQIRAEAERHGAEILDGPGAR